jgi:uncharacterized protein (TIGR02265 family)
VRSHSRDSGGDLSPFRDPNWNAPFDLERELESIPMSAQVRGMFILPALQEAKRAKVSMVQRRERYLPFQFYPLREHARLLADTAAAVYPKMSMREGLRKLGRGAPNAFAGSTLGRVLLQAAQGVEEVVGALAKGYELTLNPGRALVEVRGPRCLDVILEDVHYFVDCHHVGAFEGAIRYANAKGRVRLQRISARPGLKRTTSGRVRRVGIGDLAHVTQALVLGMTKQRIHEAQAGLALGFRRAAVRPEPCFYKGPQQPGPHGALMISGIALARTAAVSSNVAGLPWRERAQTKRREQLSLHARHDLTRALRVEQSVR